MLGLIVTYSAQARGGVIRTPDHKNHCFFLNAWQENVLPEPGQRVEFTLRGKVLSDIKLLKNVAADPLQHPEEFIRRPSSARR